MQMQAFHCPICKAQMHRISYLLGRFYYRCQAHGIWTPGYFFSKLSGCQHIEHNLRKFQAGPFPQSKVEPRSCPECRGNLKPTYIEDRLAVVVDQCLRCQGVWFDAGEMEAVATLPQVQDLFPKIPVIEKKQKKIKLPCHMLEESVLDGSKFHPLMFIGLPVVDEKYVVKTQPVMAYVIILVSLLMTSKGFKSDDFLVSWAFDPLEPKKHYGLTFFSSVLLHGNAWHFLSNFYFFYICADNIEDRRGPAFLALVFFLSAIGGKIAYMMSGGTQISIGASGGVVGLLVFYALKFPANRFHILYRRIPIKLSPFLFLMHYLAIQFIFAMVQAGPGGDRVNYIAHLGGAAVGFLFYLEDTFQRPND